MNGKKIVALSRNATSNAKFIARVLHHVLCSICPSLIVYCPTNGYLSNGLPFPVPRHRHVVESPGFRIDWAFSKGATFEPNSKLGHASTS